MIYGTAPLGSLPIGGSPAYTAPAAEASERVIILSPQDFDEATLVAGSEVATLPAANLQAMDPRKVWRSGASADFLNVTFTVPVAANCLVLAGHDLGASGVLRVRGAATLAECTSGPAIDTGWRSAWPTSGRHLSKRWPSYLSALRWNNDSEWPCWRIDIADPDVTKTYFQIGRLALGRSWQPSTNWSYGGTPLGFDQRDAVVITEYGKTFTERRTTSAPRLFAVSIEAANRREVLDGIAEIQRLRGQWGDVFCLLDPGADADFHRQSMQGVFQPAQTHQAMPYFDADGEVWTASLTLREVI